MNFSVMPLLVRCCALGRGIRYSAAPAASAIDAAEYWIARSSRAMTAVFVAYQLRKRMSV
ncbi:hypothetical protein BST63_18990 [Bradyrhizobium canariense]|uniref:Uncharacterized protein n=1 Tax=Bradyrhizobium canariense TaxID=255045 RepID=A0ABX3X2X9_9BRAD|nr:hypothetical protein BSZ21_16185 [Bradyrhizobium canariense]OSI69949.1 hypothetical protein BSZ22_16010 [Bradyrhizobium canariense]OSI74906.1 hypothetical protein BSZ23_31935 [Bradyrhizobium canariense]OSI98492.1 hypothetical protein BSZ16_31925 [Bradyrhizobium canariense]OSJ27371.1 hypothetical protein BST63_18990 [Bradyrhizobium canariense]